MSASEHKVPPDKNKAVPTLAERWPCLPGERHTFAPNQLVCLCGSLSKIVPEELPFVTLIHPTSEQKP